MNVPMLAGWSMSSSRNPISSRLTGVHALSGEARGLKWEHWCPMTRYARMSWLTRPRHSALSGGTV